MSFFGKKKKSKGKKEDSSLSSIDKLNQMEDPNFTIKGDRAGISVGNKKGNKKLLKLVLFLLIAGLLLVILIFFKFAGSKKEVVVINDEQIENQNAQADQYNKTLNSSLVEDMKKKENKLSKKSLDEMKVETEKEEKREEEVKLQPQPIVSNELVLPVSDESSKGGKKGKEITPEQRRLMGNVLVDNKGSGKSSSGDGKSVQEVQEDNLMKNNGSRGVYKNGGVSVVKNRSLLLSSGTSIPCVLKTEIITSYPALTLCQITKNVYSADGKYLLIRSGSLVQGEQTKVMMQGIARVFVNWNTILDGDLEIRVDALAAGTLGASGVPAWIDTHFWERFGGALMLSFIDDALTAAASHAQNDNVSVDNVTNTSSTMAEIALSNSINISPTAYILQGTMMSIMVPRNVDFSSVYQAY